MKLFFQLFTTLIFFGLAGCATKPKPPVPPAPAPAASNSNTTTPAQTNGSGPITRALPPGEYTVLVESVPSGAMVVVNGIPVGKSPQRILLPGTTQGFFRDQVSLKVRFIGVDAAHPSKTVEELLTPLDRIPAGVRFTSAGAVRQPR